MEKRKLLIGDYDTAADGLWTLTYWMLTKGAQVQTFVQVPGRAAPLDLSTYLTDGQPYYDNATLEAVLESSEGDRLARKLRIDLMANYLDGRTLHIYLPDDLDRYLVGRVQVYPEYNDLAHCSVRVSAICDPWLYAKDETKVTLTATETEQTTQLYNYGRLAVVPTLVLTGETRIQYGERSWALSAGEYILPELCLTPGEGLGLPGVHSITYAGSGSITITYREAVLAV
jgi:hypothetical protein